LDFTKESQGPTGVP